MEVLKNQDRTLTTVFNKLSDRVFFDFQFRKKFTHRKHQFENLPKLYKRSKWVVEAFNTTTSKLNLILVIILKIRCDRALKKFQNRSDMRTIKFHKQDCEIIHEKPLLIKGREDILHMML